MSGVIKSPLKFTYSLEVCHGADSNVYLSLGGINPKYSSDVSDLFKVTKLYNGSKKKSGQLLKENNQTRILLQEKDETIDTLNLKIKQLEELEADLKKQKKQNHGKSNQKNLKTKSIPFSKRTNYLNYKTQN